MYVCRSALVCMYVCMPACLPVCMYVWLYVCMYVCMYACLPVCMYVCMYACMSVGLSVCRYDVCVCQHPPMPAYGHMFFCCCLMCMLTIHCVTMVVWSLMLWHLCACPRPAVLMSPFAGRRPVKGDIRVFWHPLDCVTTMTPNHTLFVWNGCTKFKRMAICMSLPLYFCVYVCICHWLSLYIDVCPSLYGLGWPGQAWPVLAWKAWSGLVWHGMVEAGVSPPMCI